MCHDSHYNANACTFITCSLCVYPWTVLWTSLVYSVKIGYMVWTEFYTSETLVLTPFARLIVEKQTLRANSRIFVAEERTPNSPSVIFSAVSLCETSSKQWDNSDLSCTPHVIHLMFRCNISITNIYIHYVAYMEHTFIITGLFLWHRTQFALAGKTLL